MGSNNINPAGLDAMVEQLGLLAGLLAAANPWPGWSPLGSPVLLVLSEGTNLLIGTPEIPTGFRLLEPHGDCFLATASYRTGFIDAPPLVLGTLAGTYRAVALGPDLVVPVVQVTAGHDPLVDVGLLARNLFRVQVAARLAVYLDVRAGIGEDELDELLAAVGESLSAPTERARLTAFLLELQRAYERYPETSLLNNVLGNLEGRMLYGHLTSDGFASELGDATGLPAALAIARALALSRRERYGNDVPPSQIAFERRMEVYEGLPRYVELALFRTAATMATKLLPDQTDRARRLLAGRVGLLPQLNQRGWGASRRRFYHTGMALGFLLDGAVPGWRSDLVSGHLPLDAILETVVEYDGSTVDERILDLVRERYGYYQRLEDERTWTRDIDARRREVAARILEGPGTRISVDVSELAERSVWCDPATVERIGESTLVHVRPGVFTYGEGGTFVEFRGLSVIEDQRSRLLHATLPGPMPRIFGDDEALPMIKGLEFTDGLEVELGGLKVRARRGAVVRDGPVLFIKLLE